MKKIFSYSFVLSFVAMFFISCESPTTSQIENSNEINSLAKKGDFTTLQDGVILYSSTHYLAGTPIPVGYDVYGYNYQGHVFKGSYANAYLGGYGFPPYEGSDEAYLADNPTVVNNWAWVYRNTDLLMKWNDAWISNKDCDGDGKLDRYYGFDSYIGSGAWLTNHMKGGEGKETWTYFTKIVAAPEDAVLGGSFWYTADGTEIGSVIWGQFATILEVESGSGVTYLSPAGPGFGQY